MSADLEFRVLRLEKTNRYLLWGLVAIVFCLLLTWGLMPTRDVAPAASPALFEKVVARELSIVDASGAEIAAIRPGRGTIEERDAKILLKIGDGKLGSGKLGNGKPYAIISAGQSEAAIVVSGARGSDPFPPRTWMQAFSSRDGPIAIVGVNNGLANASLFAGGPEPFLTMGNAAGTVRSLSVDDIPRRGAAPAATPADDGAAEHERKQRQSQRRIAEWARLSAQAERGEINQAELWQRIADLSQKQAEEP